MAPPQTVEQTKPAPADDAVAAPVRVDEAALFQLVNRERIRAGIAPLQFAPELLDVARERAAGQDADAALTHYDIDGHLVFAQLVGTLGLPYRLIGENLARVPGQEAVAERAAEALMRSATHRANILEPGFDRLAVGSATDMVGRTVFAQIFGASQTN
jgi:uncharacterized protein YkwD